MPDGLPRILLVDDDRELVALMSEFLASQGYAVSVAYNGREGLEAALNEPYDLVLLDVMMPGLDGFEVLRRLRSACDVPILMLTARAESQSRILGLDSGADDYLAKPFEPLELVARIRAILRRTRQSLVDGNLELGGVRLEPATRRVFLGDRQADLTSIEYDILEMLMRSAGRVVTRDELMRRLYKRDATIFDRAIDVHISHLRRKLEELPDLIRTVRGAGYQFAAEQPAVKG